MLETRRSGIGERAAFATRSPHMELLGEVMARALTDLFVIEAQAEPGDAYRAHYEAVRFWTDQTGGWAQSRESICLALDKDPDRLRAMVIDLLEERVNPDLPQSMTRGSFKTARAIWAEIKAEAARDAAMRRWAKDHKVRATRKPVVPAPEPSPVPMIERIHDALLDGPLTIREIGFSIEGGADSTTIRKHLDALIEQGLVERDPPHYLIKGEESPSSVLLRRTG